LPLFKYKDVMCIAGLWKRKRTRWTSSLIPDVSCINSIYVF
jgi:hypothetical protein